MLTPRSLLIYSLRQRAAMVSDNLMADGRPDEVPASREEL